MQKATETFQNHENVKTSWEFLRIKLQIIPKRIVFCYNIIIILLLAMSFLLVKSLCSYCWEDTEKSNDKRKKGTSLLKVTQVASEVRDPLVSDIHTLYDFKKFFFLPQVVVWDFLRSRQQLS